MTKTRSLTVKNLMQDWLRCCGDQEGQDKMWWFAYDLRGKGYISAEVWSDFQDKIAKLYYKFSCEDGERWEDADGRVIFRRNLETCLFDRVVR